MERERMVDIDIPRTIEVENEYYRAHYIGEKMDWGLGGIEAPDFNEAEKKEIAANVIESMVRVDTEEQRYSGCTDGRIRVQLADGTAAPVREKLVGADIITAFMMAEALGARFYPDPEAPLPERLKYVADFLLDNNYLPSTHGPSCGAAAGFVTIVENGLTLMEKPKYIQRQQLILPNYNADIHAEVRAGYKARLSRGLYNGWSEDLVRNAVLDSTGEKGVKMLLDDGTGVHGHNEGLIARIKPNGVTVGATQFSARMRGLQLFTVNDGRQERLAQLFGRGDTQEHDYLVALHASEDLQDSGHATLSKNLETLVVEAK